MQPIGLSVEACSITWFGFQDGRLPLSVVSSTAGEHPMEEGRCPNSFRRYVAGPFAPPGRCLGNGRAEAVVRLTYHGFKPL